MAGGIFTDRPFEPNMKCIVFAIIMIIAYLYLVSKEKRNFYIIPLIFVGAYVAMAWYDWLYSCETKMYSGTKGVASLLDSIFKPQRRTPEPDIKHDPERQKHLLPDQEKAYLNKVYWFHAVAVAPLLLYVGYKGKQADDKLFGVLAGMGGLAALYHTTRIFIPRQVN
jgi:hypothetical protein